jgi:nitrogen-specific signal transduction histidine kinase
MTVRNVDPSLPPIRGDRHNSTGFSAVKNAFQAMSGAAFDRLTRWKPTSTSAVKETLAAG